jgi:monolysocardiolipin acyltransferase
MHSKHGGLFQPTVTQAVRLLSRQPFTVPPYHPPTTFPSLDTFPYPSPPISTLPASSVTTTIPSDPFTDSSLTYPHTYTTTGNDIFPAPSSFSAHRYSWVHIFPEGRVHQHPHKTMRYFKWGVARLILEPDVLPDIVPVWIEGNDEVMHEARTFPRFLPRVGKKLGVWFGDNVGGQTLEAKPFHELRARWRMLVERERRITGRGQREVGELTEELKYGEEAVQLRIECTKRVREEVLKVRRLRGLEDEDPKEGLVETWIEEGGRMDGEMDDGSFVKDM